MTNIKVSKEFKKKSDFNEIRHKRRCWNKCHSCEQDWPLIETEFVHMINYQDPSKYINGNGTFFICDNCLTKHKEQ